MGKTNQPLVIVVEPEWVDHPQVRALAEKGHSIVPITPQNPEARIDLILARAAWNWDDEMFDEKGRNLETTLKAARKERKSGKKGK